MIARLIAGVCVLLFAASCAKETQEDSSPEPTLQGATIIFPTREVPGLAMTAAKEEQPPPIQLNGRLAWDEDRTVRLFSPFTGRVTQINVQPGQAVAKGQALAVLSSPEFGQAQAEARRAEADLGLAEKNLQRVRELESNGVAPRKELQSVEAEYARAQAEVERARARVKLYRAGGASVDQTFPIASPIAGTVVERNINPGQEVRADQATSNAPPLFVVTDPRRLWVILDASEKDLPELKIGKIVSIHTPVFREETFKAQITAVSDFLDPNTRTLKVRATLDNAERRLKAEMFVTGEVKVKQQPLVYIPSKALFFQGGKHYVFTEDEPGRYTRREVKPGDEHDGKVEVEEGLKDGDRVVSDGVLMLQQTLQPRRVQK